MKSIEAIPEQVSVIAFDNNLVVIARPGSGKTFVVSEKVRNILPRLATYQGVIAISFTNKASNELKVRCKRNGINTKSSFFGTIDKFCFSEIVVSFLKQLWGMPRSEIAIEKLSDLPADENRLFALPKSDEQLSIEKNIDIIREYYLKGRLFLEFNGLLALYVLRNSIACRKYIQARYTHVFIDEYQDSGLEQHNIFLELESLGLTAIAVGDVDQSIFGFSGKSSKYLVDLSNNSKFTTFPLNDNHRCHNSIINYSLRLLNAKTSLLPVESINVFLKIVGGTQSDVGTWIESMVPEVIEKYAITKKCNIGVLVRSNQTGELINGSLKIKHRFFHSVQLEEHFSLWAQLFCSLLYYRFNERNTAEDIIREYAKILSEPVTLRMLRTAIKSIRFCSREELKDICVRIAQNILPRATNVKTIELLSAVIASQQLLDSFKPALDDEVQVMTLHKAKGLEFDVVFHLDLYEWSFPAKVPGPENDWDHPVYNDFTQDLNLHYVGVTRARKACVLCTSTKRFNYLSQMKNGKPSEFLLMNNLDQLRNNL